MSERRRVLVVANRTADSEELHEALVELHARDPIRVTLLAPACWEASDPHGGRESALRRLRAAATRLTHEGIAIETVVGDPDPMTAVTAIWDPERFDEVIVATLPQQLSRWLRLDLPRRVERLTARSVRHVVAHERAAMPAG
jgi:hypothetical protein